MDLLNTIEYSFNKIWRVQERSGRCQHPTLLDNHHFRPGGILGVAFGALKCYPKYGLLNRQIAGSWH